MPSTEHKLKVLLKHIVVLRPTLAIWDTLKAESLLTILGHIIIIIALMKKSSLTEYK